MVDYYTIPLELTLQSPFLLSGVGAQAYGIDVRQQRDEDGRLLMPATQVRGILRHAMEAMAAANVQTLFGQEGEAPGAGGRLVFGDLTAEPETSTGNLLTVTRTAIDDDTGAAKDGHLLTLELPAKPRQNVTFKGEVRLTADNQASAEAVATQFEEALELVAAIGKNKTAGYGRLTGRHAGPAKEFRKSKAPPFVSLPGPADAFAFIYSFALDRPLLVDTEYPEANFMRSADQIGGAVLKGALAQQLDDAGEDIEKDPFLRVLSRLRFEFARPLLPPSLPGKALDGRDRPAPAPERTVRMRVGINAEKGAAEKGLLFSQSLIKAAYKGCPLRWQCVVSWPAGGDHADRAALEACFGTLAAGLVHIGKTGAAMQSPLLDPVAVPTVLNGAAWRIELQTTALMLRVRHLEDETTLQTAIERYWQEASRGALTLASDEDGGPAFWATQSLRGGFAQAKYAAYDPANRLRVEPFVLMDPGSVFILTATGQSDGATALNRWLAEGLPAARWSDSADTLKFAPASAFADLPYLPENGYGKVSITPVAPPTGAES